MNFVLQEHLEEFVIVYLNDIFVYSQTYEEHVQHIEWVLTKLEETNLKLKLEKCEFAKREIKVLEHRVDAEGTRPDPGKVEAILKQPRPTTITGMRAFLGAAGFFKKYIQDFGKIATPLHHITSNKISSCWTKEMELAWEELHYQLTQTPVLRHPNFKKPFILYMDASKEGIGAVLCQKDENVNADYVIQYYSRTLAEGQKNWSTIDLECLAIIEAIRHFDPYLRDTTFTLYTNHEALATLRTQSQPKGRRARWIAKLKNYQFHAKHFLGKENHMADYLLRYPVGEPLQMLEKDVRMSKFVRIVLYNRK